MQNNTFSDFFTPAATNVATRQKNTVLRNTFIALGACMVFATTAALLSILTGFAINPMIVFIAIIGLSFAIQIYSNRPLGLVLLFVFAGLLGLNLGPILSYYLAVNMGDVIAQAFGLTAVAFFGLTFYVINTKKDFSFMSGFLTVFGIVLIVAVIASFFIKSSLMYLAISGAFAVFSSLMILFEVSRVVNGGETNYIRATLSIFMSIYNLFVSLLAILGNNRN